MLTADRWYSTLLTSLQTYGSLGAAIGFVTWLSISAIVLLPGTELDAEMEHQIASHTTTGTPKPRSKRFNGIHVRAKWMFYRAEQEPFAVGAEYFRCNPVH